MYGPIEEDPEYKLIVESNNLTVEIDNEIGENDFPLLNVMFLCLLHIFGASCLFVGVVHKYVRDLYAKRFPVQVADWWLALRGKS